MHQLVLDFHQPFSVNCKFQPSCSFFWLLFHVFFVFLKAVALFPELEWWMHLQKGKEITPFFFLWFSFCSEALLKTPAFWFLCVLDLDIMAVLPVHLDAVLTVKGFRGRGAGCNTRVTGCERCLWLPAGLFWIPLGELLTAVLYRARANFTSPSVRPTDFAWDLKQNIKNVTLYCVPALPTGLKWGSTVDLREVRSWQNSTPGRFGLEYGILEIYNGASAFSLHHFSLSCAHSCWAPVFTQILCPGMCAQCQWLGKMARNVFAVGQINSSIKNNPRCRGGKNQTPPQITRDNVSKGTSSRHLSECVIPVDHYCSSLCSCSAHLKNYVWFCCDRIL